MPSLTRSLKFGGTIDVSLDSADASLLRRFVDNMPLAELDPPDVLIGNVSAHAEVPLPTLGPPDRAIAFQASGGAMALLGTVDAPADVVQQLDLDDALEGLRLDLPPGRYTYLATGYDAAGTAKGKMALGAVPGTVAVELGGSRRGTYAVVQRVSDATGILTAFEGLFRAVRLPRDVRGAEDLAADTWIVTEVDGGLKASVRSELGYSFNWLRETAHQGLAGDVGLKVRLNAALAYAVQAQGRFVIVVGHGARAGQVRLRVLRRRRVRHAGELSVGATAQASIDVPDSPAAFVDAVLGLRTEQLLKDVRRLLDITTDPAKAADSLLQIAKDEASAVLDALDPARDRLRGALDAWDRLDDIAADAVGEAIAAIGTPGAARLKELVSVLASVQGGDELAAIIRKELDERNFRGFTGERWLWAVLERGPLDALVDTSQWKKVQTAARATLEVLDGTAAGELVRRLQALAERELHLDAVRTAADPAALNAWLRAKLAGLLGRTVDASGLESIQQAIDEFERKARDVYSRVVEAAKDEYAFTVTAGVAPERTREALIDAEFDTTSDAARRALAAAIDGDFADLLLHPPDGVVVHAGTLADGIERRQFITVTLPFFSATDETLASATARLTVAREGGGVYVLDARNEVRSRTRTSSALAVQAAFPVRGVEVHGRSASYAYAFRQFTKDARTDALALQLETYARAYFAGSFEDAGAFDENRFRAWIDGMERQINERADRWDAPALFGSTVIGLDLRLPPEAVLAWTRAPAAKKDPLYYALSRALQAAVRRWLFFYYYQDLDRLVDERSEPLLVFTAMPSFNDAFPRGISGFELVSDRGNLFWDYRNRQLVEAVIHAADTRAVLEPRLARIRAALVKAGIPPGNRFTLGEVLRHADAPGLQRSLLEMLLRATSVMIEGAVEAGRAMRTAMDESRPDKVLAALRTFGEEITETFNADAASFLVDGTNFRPLATLIYLEGARVFDPALDTRVVGQLSVTALKEESAFSAQDLAVGKHPGGGDILLDDRVVRV